MVHPMPTTAIIPAEKIERSIYLVRNQKVMLDADLADLYCVETKVLTRAVKRNMGRFPTDFMFKLKRSEWEFLRCQFGTSRIGHGGRRYLRIVFDAIRKLLTPDTPPENERPIGFRLHDDE